MTESIAASCSIGERDSLSSTRGKEELDDNEDEDEDEDECQWKLYLKCCFSLLFSSCKCFLAPNDFLEQKESL